jgi:hypothetical protein
VSTEVPEELPANAPGFPAVIRVTRPLGETSIVLVNGDGILFERDGRRWRALPTSGILNVTAALGWGEAGFILGTSSGLALYFEPELGVQCPFIETSNQTEIFDLELHEDGFLIAGRSRVGPATWAYVRPVVD